MRKQFLLVAIFAALIFLPVTLFAQQAPAVEWQKVYGGIYNDNLWYVEPIPNGGYILGGYSDSDQSGDKSENSRGGTDYWIIKTDADGKKIWDRTYGGNGDDYLYVVKPTKDGGYLAGGWSGSDASGDRTQPDRGGYDIWLVRLDANGNKLWDKVLGGSSFDAVNTILTTQDGGYLIGGTSRSPVNGDKSQPSKGSDDFWLVKLDANGNIVWDKIIGGNDQDDLISMQETSDGGYILGGASMSGKSGDKSQDSKGQKDYWVVKVDANGNFIWDKTFGGALDDHFTCIKQTPEGGYILGGVSRSPKSGDKSENNAGGIYNYWDHDLWIIKIDEFGNKIWDRTYGGNQSERLFSLDISTDGGYVLGGTSFSGINKDKSQPSNGAGDFWVLKIDANGHKVWDKTLGGNSFETLFYLQQTSDGGYILGGESSSEISGDKTQVCQGAYDFWLVKLAPEFTEEGSSEIKIFPNPNRGEFNFQTMSLEGTELELTIYDYTGQVVLKEMRQVKNKLISEKVKLPTGKGIYFMQLRSGRKVLTSKIIVE